MEAVDLAETKCVCNENKTAQECAKRFLCFRRTYSICMVWKCRARADAHTKENKSNGMI